MIKWLDHYSNDNGWYTEFKPEDYLITSVGFLVKTTKDFYVLATNLAKDGQQSCIMTIIRKAVKEKRVIE